MQRSGLSGVYRRFTFDNYQTLKPWQAEVKRKAEGYASNPKGWFFVGGNSGAGKSHICIAIAGELIKRGYDVRFMAWREESPKLKGAIVSGLDRYEKMMNTWKNCPVLYIDDFWKGRVTDADINLAFELLNHRDMSNRPTIISSEMSIEQICANDEAIGSRIAQQARALCIRTPDENYRLSGRLK